MYISMPALWRPAYVLGTFQRHVERAIVQHVHDGAVAYDVGANVGYFTMILARRAGPTGSVVAFEPDARNVAALRANVSENRLFNARVVESAVVEQSMPVTLATYSYVSVSHVVDGEIGRGARLLPVNGISLDDFVYRAGNPAPSFVKIDVEGAEGKVIRGMRRILREARPVVVAEVRPGRGFVEVVDEMIGAGYRARETRPGRGAGTNDASQDLVFMFMP
jgi:FkbM family methyltransferase